MKKKLIVIVMIFLIVISSSISYASASPILYPEGKVVRTMVLWFDIWYTIEIVVEYGVTRTDTMLYEQGAMAYTTNSSVPFVPEMKFINTRIFRSGNLLYTYSISEFPQHPFTPPSGYIGEFRFNNTIRGWSPSPDLASLTYRWENWSTTPSRITVEVNHNWQ